MKVIYFFISFMHIYSFKDIISTSMIKMSMCIEDN